MNEEIQSNEGPDLQPQIQAVESLIDEGNYDAALARARGLFDDYPDRAEAYTLLGDIYAARRMWPEAVEWYHEGAERGDSSAADKLREARAQLTRQLEQPGQPRRAASASQAEQQRTKLWITLASAGAVVVIAVVIGALTFSGGPPSGPEQPSVQRPTGPSSAAPGTRSPRSTARSTTSALQARSGSAATSPRLPTGSGTEPTFRSTVPGGAISPRPQPQDESTTIIEKGPRSEQDMILESTLGSLTWPDGTAMRNDVSVAVDPFLGYAMITFEIPRNLDSDDMADTTARQAYSVATTAINTDQSLTAITVRGVINTSSSQRRKRVAVAYRGNTTRESLTYWLGRDQSPTSQQLWTHVFATTWWNPAIPRSGFE